VIFSKLENFASSWFYYRNVGSYWRTSGNEKILEIHRKSLERTVRTTRIGRGYGPVLRPRGGVHDGYVVALHLPNIIPVSRTFDIYVNADIHEMFRMSPHRHLAPLAHLPSGKRIIPS